MNCLPSIAPPGRGRSAFGIALTAVLLGAVDLTAISTILPAIVADLGVNTADIDRYIWVVNAYLLAYVVAIPLFGGLSDLLGRRLTFQIALAIFLTGSVGSAIADSLAALITARAVQGAGGGALLPVALALVGDLYPTGKRAPALGLVGAVDTLGWALGPVWGAVILGGTTDGWRWVFWVNVPLSLLIAAAMQRRLRDIEGDLPSRRSRPFDFAGALLIGAALLLLNLGLSSGGEIGVTTGSAFRALGGTHNPLADHLAWLLLGGAAVAAAFVIRERRSTHPLVPSTLWRSRRSRAALAANFLTGAALIAGMVDVAVAVALLTPDGSISTRSALLLAPFTALMAIASFVGAAVFTRSSLRAATSIGVVAAAAGYTAVAAGLLQESELAMVPGLALAGIGFGLISAPTLAAVIESAEADGRGVAASIVILARLVGMTVGLSAITAFGVWRLQSLTSDVEPIVRQENESTASFFARQAQYIQDVAIPLALRAVRESLLIAGAVVVLAGLVFWLFGNQNHADESVAETSPRSTPGPTPTRTHRRSHRSPRGAR